MEGLRIRSQCAEQGRRQLEMRDAMPEDFSRDLVRVSFAMNHYLESSRESPEQFERRDVEGYAGHGQPGTGLDADDSIHAGEEINDVAVLDHYPFWLSCRTRGADDV